MAKTLLDYAPKNGANTTTSRAQGLLEYAKTTQTAQTNQEDTNHNKGGFLGGVGYTLGKLGTGAFSVLEGIWDFTAGGIADFFGADEWAEEQFANNIAAGWNQDLDEWYNPSKGMQMVGDVASGISNTLVGIAGAAAITYFTGGAAAPYAGTIAAGIMGVGAAGSATSEAYAKTGELGFKEYAYGALSGGTEMALEKFTGVTGKYATKLLGKETAKTVAKKSLLKGMWSDFKSEFVEEAISEFITPYYQRWTQVDPNAENATIQQMGYAGLVGGLSGALMGGIGTGISSAKALNRGNEISKNQDYTNAVVGMAEKFAQYETDNNTGKEAYQYISGLVADFKARDNGTGTLTAMQKKLLGEMEHASVVLTYEPEIQRSKEKIIANADDFAQYINSRDIIDGATGNPFRFANGAELAQNDALVTQFAVADALGQLMLAPDSVYDLVSSKRTDGIMQADFRNFQKGGRAEHKQAVNELFGIDVDGMTYEDFIETIKKTDKAKFDSIQGGMSARAASKKAISYANNTGADIGTFDKGANIVEGTTVYTSKKGAGGKIIAITKTGNGYYLYNGNDISKKLTKAQLLEVIDALNGVAPATNQATETTAKKGQKTAKKPTAQTSPAGTQTAKKSQITQSKKKTVKDLKVNRLQSPLLNSKTVSGNNISKTTEIVNEKQGNLKINNSLLAYTDQQKKNWKNSKRIVIYENNTQFKDFILESLADKTKDKKMYFGAVSKELAVLIKQKTGLELEKYNCALQASEIRKIFSDHGTEQKEQTRGQRAVTVADIVNIPNIMQAPTTIALSDKQYDGKPAIHFIKQTKNEKTTVVAVVSDKHLDLRVQTEYVGVKKRNLSAPIDEQASINTPQANAGTVSTNSIPETSGKVNTFDKKNQEKEKNGKTTAPKKETATTKTTPKAKATETTTAKPVKEKTIHGKTYKDFTVEEFKALSAPFRGYYLAKSKKPDAIVFAQLGDFYEVFFDDAKTLANEFDLTLTGRAVNGYTDRVEMVGFPVAKFDDYKAKLNAKGLDVVKVDLDGKKVLYAAKTDSASTETQVQTEKPKKANTANTTAKKKMDDFGEKIGGARKDEWQARGLTAADLDGMNLREIQKYAKKERVWKRPNWVQAVENGGDRGLLYAQNEIYISLNTQPASAYSYKSKTEEQIKAVAKTYADEVNAIKKMAESVKTADDLKKMGREWLAENGYVEIKNGQLTWTHKYYESPALYGSKYLNTLDNLIKRFDMLGERAYMEGFGIAPENKLPRGYEIRRTRDSMFGSVSETGEYYIVKGHYRVATGFKTVEDALAYGREKFGNATTTEKSGKQRYVPIQLAEVHRDGLDYRKGKKAVGDDFLHDFGIKGGEFGNWLSELDRQTSLDYGYDAFCDLADALGIELTDIGLNGTLSIGFGSRGKGLSGAAAHYEPARKVINLTKMNGAGSLAHEFWHAVEDYISGDTHQSEMTSNFSKMPERTRKAAYDLVHKMQYREGTIEENQLESQKRAERNLRRINAYFDNNFNLLNGKMDESTIQRYVDEKYYKRKPTEADYKRFAELKAQAIKGDTTAVAKFIDGERSIVDEISDLQKDITGRGLQKEDRNALAYLIQEAGLHPDVKVTKKTKFYTDAIAISVTYAKDGGYWDSNCEMLARAFAAYITDKTNRSNDYLSGHSERTVLVEGGTASIMPVGEERKMINAAFDELFAAAKADGLFHESTREKPTTKTRYAISESAGLNNQPAGNKSQNLTPLQMKRAESFARTHVKGYENLTAAEKLEVEWTIASGWRYGASESDILSLAKISAQSGVGIGFADLKATTSDGKTADADAACYSRSGHLTIYLNPKSKRTVEVATLHELTHALEGTEGYAELRKKAEEYYAKHPEEKAAIDKMYRELYKNEQVRYADEILPSELTAHYIEKMLEKRNVLAQMTAEQPTFMQRCINWLKTRVSSLRGVDTQAADEVDILARKFVSTYNLNKNKMGTTQQLDKTDKIRYAYRARNPQTVTKSEFEHHYWATANGILTKNELGSLNSAIGEMRNGAQYVKNADGLYMVPIGENGVLNKIVFTDGKYNSYSIDTVITINLNNETDLSIERSIIYASERKGIYTETNGLVEVHYAKDFKFSDFQRKLTQNPQNSNGKQNGAGNLNSDSGNGVKRSYALSVVDSDGKALSAAQQDYFKDSKVRDENGRLLTVYHGTEGEFFTFDKALRGSVTGTRDAKLGFFFTSNKEVALEYAIEAQLNKYTNLMHKIANGDRKVLGLLAHVDGYKELAATEDVEEFGRLQDKSERYENDIIEVYLNIANPLIEDWSGKPYKKGRMLKLVTRALQGDYDGVIVKNIDDTFAQTGENISDVFVAFDPEQIKLTTNISPTKNPDMRYALKGSDKVTTELPNGKTTIKDVITRKASATELAAQVKDSSKEFTEGWQVSFTNAQAAVERVMKEAGIQDATAITNYVRAGKNAGMNALEVDGAQFTLDGETRVGDSWGKIWQPIYKANEKDGKIYADFQLYLLHWHNIDRMAVGKPVFHDNNTPVAEQVTAADSQTAIAELDKEYPQFRKIAEKVWKFNDNNLQLNVDSGKWSQEYADTLREMYPHYVPTGRVEHSGGVSVIQGRNDIRVNNDKKRAVGSGKQILPIDDMVAQQTIQKYQSARINKMLVDLLNGNSHEEFRVVSSEDISVDIDTDTLVKTYEDKAKNTHQITFYHDGKRITIETSRNFWKGIDAIQPSSNNEFNNGALRILAKINSGFKKLVTSLNPFFSYFRNVARDLQTAGMYTRYKWRDYVRALHDAKKQIQSNGKYWQEAKAAGILSASVYDYERGLTYKKEKSLLKRVGEWAERGSSNLEMIPRLAEYILSRKSGLSVQASLLRGQDVTTNFGRGGTIAKKLNSTVMPFLNPAIQGFSKMWRAYTGKDATRSLANLIIRTAILGVGLSALNDLLNGDDEEYENLSDYVKEQNYVIALGNGDFLKIPKGREAGIVGEIYLRTKRAINGEENAWDGYVKNILSSVTPTDNLTRHILSPFIDMQTNTTWYGGAIESEKWSDTRPTDRYDESTSSIAIWLGKMFNYSPVKIHYLLDQYSGIVGDVLLPLTTIQAEKGIFAKNMLTNSTTNSKWSDKFYSAIEEYTYKKTDGDDKAKATLKYLNAIKSEISDMYQDKREIQADTGLSNDEKLKQTQIMQATINLTMQESLENAKYLYTVLEDYDLSEDNFDTSYLHAIRGVVSAEFALKSYNKKVYEKAGTLNKFGIDYDTYYDYYFGLKEIEGEKDANGETISGSKKKAVIEYVMSQDFPMTQKLILLMTQYKISDGDIKGLSAEKVKLSVAKYITKLDLTREEKAELAQLVGFTVKNGKIYYK